MANDNMNIGLVHNFKLMSGLLDTPEGENGIRHPDPHGEHSRQR